MTESSSIPTLVYIDPAWLTGVSPSKILPVAAALAGLSKETFDEFTRDHFVRCLNYAGSIELAPASKADVILFPFPESPERLSIATGKWEYASQLESASALARRQGIPIVFHSYSKDVVDPQRQFAGLPDNSLIFNMCLLRHHPHPRSLSMPYFVPDNLAYYYKHFQHGPCDNTPRVSFCGIASPLGCSWSRTTLYDWCRLATTYVERFGVDSNRVAEFLGTNMKHAHRARAIHDLERDRRISMSTILRPSGGLVSRQYYREARDSPYNVEYYSGIYDSDYVLCSRGTENYSIRLYEVFCFGRIPVLIDTNVVLPFPDEIDYEECCVVVPPRKIHETGRRILEFHRKHSPSELAEKQQRNRKIWEKYFSAPGFYSRLGGLARRFE